MENENGRGKVGKGTEIRKERHEELSWRLADSRNGIETMIKISEVDIRKIERSFKRKAQP